jgi:hypothetical protein
VPKKQNIDPGRELLLALYKAGGDAEIACTLQGQFSLAEYEQALEGSAWPDFRDSLNDRFVQNLDGILVGELYDTLQHLKLEKGGAGLRDLSNHFTKLLDLTEPIIERKAAQMREEDFHKGLTLVIPSGQTQGQVDTASTSTCNGTEDCQGKDSV